MLSTKRRTCETQGKLAILLLTTYLFIQHFQFQGAGHDTNYSRVLNKRGWIFFFVFFSFLHVLIRDILFIKSPPVLLIFNKKFPPTLLFGIPVMFVTLEYIIRTDYSHMSYHSIFIHNKYIVHTIECWHLVHNSHHRQNYILHCLSHHHSNHLQSN